VLFRSAFLRFTIGFAFLGIRESKA